MAFISVWWAVLGGGLLRPPKGHVEVIRQHIEMPEALVEVTWR